MFELWDAGTGELLAVTAGYGCGRCFHDYSMRALVRDKRSAGHVLTKVVARVLRDCGYSIWYWGYKLGYMLDLERGGFGREFERAEFWTRWEAGLTAGEPSEPVRGFVESGKALVAPLGAA